MALPLVGLEDPIRPIKALVPNTKALRRVRKGGLPEGVILGRIVGVTTCGEAVEPSATSVAPSSPFAAPPRPIRASQDNDKAARRTDAVQGVELLL